MPQPWIKPALSDEELSFIYRQYSELYEYFLSMKNGSMVAFYTQLSEKLSATVKRAEPWKWHYIEGVYHHSVKPSRQFARAVSILAAEIDGLPAIISRLERVEVYAEAGQVQHDAIVMGKSATCENRACNRVFVPNVPWRKKCPICSPPKANV